jgi:ribosomal protein S8E
VLGPLLLLLIFLLLRPPRSCSDYRLRLRAHLASSLRYTQLGVLTKGTVIEVNVADLGLVTTSGKVVWGKYAQVTNNPELDGCVNAVLLV